MIWYSDILTEDAIKTLSSYYTLNNFQSGNHSNPDVTIKQNLMMKYLTPYHHASAYLKKHINKTDFYSVNLIHKISQCYFSWYRENDFYDWHIDNYPCAGVNANMSMTIFLNDDYDGGELVIKVGDCETLHKPKPGTAVIYNTGLWHKVNPITRGDRKVILMWIESEIKDPFIREHVRELGNIVTNLDDKVDGKQMRKLEQQRINMIRQYGRS